MKKFILLSFGFLAWAFYIMSGGADFEPESARHARLDPVAEGSTQNPQLSTPDQTDPERAKVAETPSNTVTRVALNLTPLQDVLKTDTDPIETALIEAQADVVPQTDPTITSSADTPAIIPSLIVPNDDGARQIEPPRTSDDQDLREVTGNRVNVRSGPGTNFGIVNKLIRGDTVEIIQDNGNGWVKMRPLAGGTEGWMADFLLTAG